MRLRLVLWLLLGLLVVLMASIPAQASYSPQALRQCIWTPPSELGLQLKPELPVQLKARNRDYILVRYRADGGKTIYGYGLIEVAAGKKCWNPSAKPSFEVDAMVRRLPLPVANAFKRVLRQDQDSMDKQHLESMRKGHPGVPDETLREWMEGDGGPYR
jgi:hypothetical protein